MEKSWNYWDANNNLKIAQFGYSHDPNLVVFQPFFPILLRLVGQISFFNFWVLQVFLLFLMIIALYAFYRLAKLVTNTHSARQATLFLILFPTAFFFILPYSEALFLLNFSLAFYAGIKRNWFYAGAFAGLATITRPFGILIAPSLSVEWLQSEHKRKSSLFFLFVPTVVALALYFLLNYHLLGDPLAFKSILEAHWHKHFAWPLGSIWASWKRIGISQWDYRIYTGLAEALTSSLSWILVPFMFKSIRRSLAIYYLLAVLLFTSTSFILSTPRYLLSAPPFFILLGVAMWRKKIAWPLLTISGVLLIFLYRRFLHGQWAF